MSEFDTPAAFWELLLCCVEPDEPGSVTLHDAKALAWIKERDARIRAEARREAIEECIAALEYTALSDAPDTLRSLLSTEPNDGD